MKAFFTKHKWVLPCVLCVAILVLSVLLTYTLTRIHYNNNPAPATRPTVSASNTVPPPHPVQPTVAPVNPNTPAPAPNTSDTPNPSDTPSNPTDTETPATGAPPAGDVYPATAVNGDISATLTVTGDPWDNNGKKASRISMVVTNNGTESVTDWSVTFTVPVGSELSDNWNGEFEINGTSLTIKSNIDRVIAPGDSYTDAGFILLTDEVFNVG